LLLHSTEYLKDSALASLKAQQVVPAKANTAASVFKTVGKKIGSWVDAYMLQLASQPQ
jgi:hypothetical protein